MADITMCSSEDCPLETICYRKTAPVNEYWQAYAFFSYCRGEDGTISCSGFYPDGINRKRKTKKKDEKERKKKP